MIIESLFDVATVLTGDGRWTNTYEADALSCGRVHGAVDVCNVTPRTATNTPSDTGYKVVPFVQTGDQEFATRCAPADAEKALTDAMDAASEFFVAKNFWHGDVPDWAGAPEGLFLMDAGVATVAVAAGTSVPAKIAAALGAAYARHPDLNPVVHLGLAASYALPPGFAADRPRVTFVENAAYPADGVAVTGPVLVRLGSVEVVKTVNTAVNRQYVSGTRLAAVEFDPCLAVRVV
jgi:hypothetical protein